MRAIGPSSASGRRRRGLLARGGGRRRDRHELRLAAAQPQLDRAGRQLARDLVGGGRERLEQREPDRRLQRGGQALRQRTGLLAARLGGDGELAAELLDIRREVHDATMASL